MFEFMYCLNAIVLSRLLNVIDAHEFASRTRTSQTKELSLTGDCSFRVAQCYRCALLTSGQRFGGAEQTREFASRTRTSQTKELSLTGDCSFRVASFL